MKRMFMVLAATLICGACLFTSCKKDEDNNLKLEEKIIGKWMTADINGQPALTNIKFVYSFVSTTKAYKSASLNRFSEVGSHWIDQLETDVVINGNKMTLTNHPDEHTTVVEEYTVTSITANEFTANRKITFTVNGAVVDSDEETFRFIKVTADYSADILGTWEGQVTSEQDTYGDGLQHRWEYKADGIYVYYVKDGDNWVPSTNTLNEYFVDGTLLCMRWVNAGTEYREWWEIESIENGVMKWTALREDENGQRFTATFEMNKIH